MGAKASIFPTVIVFILGIERAGYLHFLARLLLRSAEYDVFARLARRPHVELLNARFQVEIPLGNGAAFFRGEQRESVNRAVTIYVYRLLRSNAQRNFSPSFSLMTSRPGNSFPLDCHFARPLFVTNLADYPFRNLKFHQ